MDNSIPQVEVWQRGPIENIPGLMQPVAHALLQAREELAIIMAGFPEKLLWERHYGLASVGFHLNHLSGVLDRLFTYARNEQLSWEQLEYLKEEAIPNSQSIPVKVLIERFNKQVDRALLQLQDTSEAQLKESRSVGRKKIPSTTIGLLFHSAEHTMRHIGQLLVTVKMLKAHHQAS